jgi:hypothetical protein
MQVYVLFNEKLSISRVEWSKPSKDKGAFAQAFYICAQAACWFRTQLVWVVELWYLQRNKKLLEVVFFFSGISREIWKIIWSIDEENRWLSYKINKSKNVWAIVGRRTDHGRERIQKDPFFHRSYFKVKQSQFSLGDHKQQKEDDWGNKVQNRGH